MRVFAGCMVALCLVASPAMAGANGAGGNAAADPGATPATSSNASTSASKPETVSSESDIQQLKDLIDAQSRQLQSQQQQLNQQQQEMNALKQQLNLNNSNNGVVAAAPIVTPAAAAIGPVIGASTANAVIASSVPAQQAPAPDLAKRIDAIETRLKSFGPFSFSGDFRLRNEPYFGGPVNNSQVRDRERYRVRLNLTAKLNNDIAGGISFATGDPNDPITTNQTANQFFTRKPFMLDRAFAVYTPHYFKPLTFTGGKFAYPWYRTELTWDNDINPEGVAEKLEWTSDKWPVLRQFALIGFQLPYAETQTTEAIKTYTQPINATIPYTNASVHQSTVYGGQLQTRWALGSWLTVTADSAFYNWHNADPIALANQIAYGNNTASSPAVGLYTLANTLTNSFQTITETVSAAGVGGGPNVTVSKQVIAAKLNSKFALSDSILQFDIKTASARWPIRLLADYVQNTEACANATPLTTTAAPVAGGVIGAPATSNGACKPAERRGNWLEARFGRQAQKGDWQFAYTHMLVEREAVMSLFDFSDMRQGSNVAQNRFEVFYQAHPNVQLGFTGLFGRQMGTTDATETLLKRAQFDVVYKF